MNRKTVKRVLIQLRNWQLHLYYQFHVLILCYHYFVLFHFHFYCRKINVHQFTMPKIMFYHWKNLVDEQMAVEPLTVHQNPYMIRPMISLSAIGRQRCQQSIRHTSKWSNTQFLFYKFNKFSIDRHKSFLFIFLLPLFFSLFFVLCYVCCISHNFIKCFHSLLNWRFVYSRAHPCYYYTFVSLQWKIFRIKMIDFCLQKCDPNDASWRMWNVLETVRFSNRSPDKITSRFAHSISKVRSK